MYYDSGHIRYFYAHVNDILPAGKTPGFHIGASKGQQTDLIYVEYHQCGAVHGRPIAPEELAKKLKRAGK
jgi:hypothetical protein